MATWNDCKNHIRETNPVISSDIDEIEALSKIVGAMIEQRHKLGLSQRELADLCGIPHSSVARIESGKSSPNISTLLKIYSQLELSIAVYPKSTISELQNEISKLKTNIKNGKQPVYDNLDSLFEPLEK